MLREPSVTTQLSHRRGRSSSGTAHDNGGTSILASISPERCGRAVTTSKNGICSDRTAICRPERAFCVRAKRSHSPVVLISLFLSVVAALRQSKPDVLFGLQPFSNLLVGVAGAIAGIRNRVPTYHGPRAFVTPSLMALDDVVYRLGLYTQMIACANTVAETYGRDDMVVVNGHDIPTTFSRAKRALRLDCRPTASSSARSAG